MFGGSVSSLRGFSPRLSLVSARSFSSYPQWTNTLNRPLSEVDPEMFDIIEREKQRQRESIVLIPSENFASSSVFEALGSVMQNKYSEGYPGKRYYGGNEFIDMAESLCQKRALSLYNLDPEKWGVNVQVLSGSPANIYAYAAVLNPHDRILSLDLPSGGHLSHGYQIPGKKISAVSVYYETMGYRLDPKTGFINYDEAAQMADWFRPKLIVAGFSAYPRNYDYKRMRDISDSVGAYLLSDMAHISGLVAANVCANPFEYSDIVTTTTHKSLRGPRAGMIFYRKGVRSVDKKGKETMYDLEDRVNWSVFPGHQGGPHNHTISALSVALHQAHSPDFVAYQKQVVANAKAFASSLLSHGIELVSGGTDNHLLLLDLRPKNIDGARVERVLELVNIAANKNTVPGDRSALVPSGLRIGTPAMTTRGLVEKDFEQVAEFLRRAIQIASDIKMKTGPKLVDFKSALNGDLPEDILALKAEVSAFARRFPMIGFDTETMRYK